MTAPAPVCIPHDILQAMAGHAMAELPDECCGVLVGRGGVIGRSVPMRNVEPGPDSYIMDPEQQMALYGDMEKAGEELLGIYHSHPEGPALPSGADLQLAFHPDAVYVIISLEDRDRPDIRAFRLTQTGFQEIPVTA